MRPVIGIKTSTHTPENTLRFRIGRFRLDSGLVSNRPADALAALDGCIVTRAEALFHLNAIEYIAMHPHFDQMAPGSEIPLYRPVITGGIRAWERQAG